MKFIKQIDLQTITSIVLLFILNRLGVINLMFFLMLAPQLLIIRMIGGALSDNRKDYDHQGFMNVKNVKMWVVYGTAVIMAGLLGHYLQFL